MNSVQSGNFTFTKTSIDGVVIVDVKSFGDERGYFMETYKKPDFVAGGIGWKRGSRLSKDISTWSARIRENTPAYGRCASI